MPALGANAISAACEIVSEIDRLASEYEAPERLDPRFDPPYSTFHVGMIHGGTARNILARECVFHWEFRGLPNASATAALRDVQAFIDSVALPRLRRFVDDPTIETVVEVDVPGLDAEPGSPAQTLACGSRARTGPTPSPMRPRPANSSARACPQWSAGPARSIRRTSRTSSSRFRRSRPASPS